MVANSEVDWEACLGWARDEDDSAPWVIAAEKIVGTDSKKERVREGQGASDRAGGD
jgi:hypothetical protein